VRAPWPVALPFAGPPASGKPYWSRPPNCSRSTFSANGAATDSEYGLEKIARDSARLRPWTTTRPVWEPEPVATSRSTAFTMLGGATTLIGSNMPIDHRMPRKIVGNSATADAARARCQRRWNGPFPGAGEAPERSMISSSPRLCSATGRRISASWTPIVSRNATER
jgi:hypothetical protein